MLNWQQAINANETNETNLLCRDVVLEKWNIMKGNVMKDNGNAILLMVTVSWNTRMAQNMKDIGSHFR